MIYLQFNKINVSLQYVKNSYIGFGVVNNLFL